MTNLSEKSLEHFLVEQGFEEDIDKSYKKALFNQSFINEYDEEDIVCGLCIIQYVESIYSTIIKISLFSDIYTWRGYNVFSVRIYDLNQQSIEFRSLTTNFQWNKLNRILKKVRKLERLKPPLQPFLQLSPKIILGDNKSQNKA